MHFRIGWSPMINKIIGGVIILVVITHMISWYVIIGGIM
jgi:hypothetical protein